MIETFKQLSDEYSKEEISFDETVHLNEQKSKLAAAVVPFSKQSLIFLVLK